MSEDVSTGPGLDEPVDVPIWAGGSGVPDESVTVDVASGEDPSRATPPIDHKGDLGEVRPPATDEEGEGPAVAGHDVSQSDEDVAEAPNGVDQAAALADAIGRLEVAITGLNERAAHREKVIDRLHEENQELKAGGERLVLEPVITALIRLYGLLNDEANRIRDPQAAPTSVALVDVLASEVELILDGCAIERLTAEDDEPFRSGDHKVVETVSADTEGEHRTVAQVVREGFRDRVSGRARQPVDVVLRRWSAPADAETIAPAPPAAEPAGQSDPTSVADDVRYEGAED